MNIEQQRAEFETWASSKHYGLQSASNTANYINTDTQWVWQAWQSAIASVSAQQELTNEEIEVVYMAWRMGEGNDSTDFARAVLAAQRAKDKGVV